MGRRTSRAAVTVVLAAVLAGFTSDGRAGAPADEPPGSDLPDAAQELAQGIVQAVENAVATATPGTEDASSQTSVSATADARAEGCGAGGDSTTSTNATATGGSATATSQVVVTQSNSGSQSSNETTVTSTAEATGGDCEEGASATAEARVESTQTGTATTSCSATAEAKAAREDDRQHDESDGTDGCTARAEARVEGGGRVGSSVRSLPALTLVAARRYAVRALRMERPAGHTRLATCTRESRLRALCRVSWVAVGNTHRGQLVIGYRKTGEKIVWRYRGRLAATA